MRVPVLRIDRSSKMAQSGFETFPDVSRKLDTILQLLQGPNGLAALNSAISRQNQINVSSAPVLSPIVSVDQGNFGVESSFAGPSLLSKQNWGEIGMQPKFGSAYVDPVTAMQTGTMSWNDGCKSCAVSSPITPTPLPAQTIVPTLPPQQFGPVASSSLNQSDLEQAMSKSNDLLEQILKKVSTLRVETRMMAPSVSSSPMPDLTNALFTINEGISEIRQLLAVRPEQGISLETPSRVTDAMMADLRQSITTNSDEIVERLDQLQSGLTHYSDLLQQIYDAVSQLVGQANDNATMINDLRTSSSVLRQTLGEAHSLLIQNINHRGSDIQQLIDENASLRAHLQKLVNAIEGEPRKKKK